MAALSEPVRQALPSLWTHARLPMYDRAPIPTWTRWRVTLLGDAAHPMLQYPAQGACQAIEDALTLVAELDAAERAHNGPGRTDPVAAAFASYAAVRAPRTARVQRAARTWGDIWHLDGAGRLVRNELFRQRRPDDHSHIGWLYDWRVPRRERRPAPPSVKPLS